MHIWVSTGGFISLLMVRCTTYDMFEAIVEMKPISPLLKGISLGSFHKLKIKKYFIHDSIMLCMYLGK